MSTYQKYGQNGSWQFVFLTKRLCKILPQKNWTDKMSSWQNVSQNTCWQNVFLTKRLSKIHDKMSPWQYVFLTKRLQTNQNMLSQTSNCTHWFITLCTFVQLLSSMRHHVLGKVVGTQKWLGTQVTKKFVVHVDDLDCRPQLIQNNWGNGKTQNYILHCSLSLF